MEDRRLDGFASLGRVVCRLRLVFGHSMQLSAARCTYIGGRGRLLTCASFSASGRAASTSLVKSLSAFMIDPSDMMADRVPFGGR